MKWKWHVISIYIRYVFMHDFIVFFVKNFAVMSSFDVCRIRNIIFLNDANITTANMCCDI